MAVYMAKNYDSLIGMQGFSEALLKNHFTLYQGYVANTNKLADALFVMAKEGKTGTPEYAELKRRFGWEFNGARLHELYFENMSKDQSGMKESPDLSSHISRNFSSVEVWAKDFKSTGACRGIGWVALYYDPSSKFLWNAWINEHDVGHLATCRPILIMDVFEHAFMLDYGLKRADYIEAFFKNINWAVAEQRFADASR